MSPASRADNTGSPAVQPPLVSSAASVPSSASLGCVNFTPQDAGSLTEAAVSLGLTPTAASPDAKDFSGKVLVWEVGKDPEGAIDASREEWIRHYVQNGGSLILTISRTPGASAMKMADISPTTAWCTENRGGPDGVVKGMEWDPGMYGAHGTQSVSFPYHFRLQPVSAAERGMARYERFDWTVSFVLRHGGAGSTYWTRPLLNRDWRIRVRGDDADGAPLVLTGRYGAGRVAVLAGGVTDLQTGTGEANFWTPLLKWLAESPGNASAEPANVKVAGATSVDRKKRILKVAVRNPTSAPLKVTVIVRLETWEQAYVGDLEQALTIPAKGTATASLALPPIDATSYQALDYRDKWDARLGILSESGATLLTETRFPIDLEPKVRLSVATDELASVEYPFKQAPGAGTPFLSSRMGIPTSSYTYAPGGDAHAILTVFNGAKNLAPLSKAADETAPGNKSLMAINDEMADAWKTPRAVDAYGMWVGQAGQENVLSFTLPKRATVNAVTLVGNPGMNPGLLGHNVGAAVIEVDGNQVARADDLDSRFQAAGRATLSFPAIAGQVVRVRLPWLNDGTPERKRVAPWLAEVEINGWLGKAPGEIQGRLKAELKDSLTGELIPVGDKDVTIKGGEIETVSLPFKAPELNGKPARHLSLQATFQYSGATEGQVNKEMPLMVIQPDHPLTSIGVLRGGHSLGLGFIVTLGFRNADKIGTGTREAGSWESPDDLIWAYSHDLKQIGIGAKTLATRFFVSDTNLAHYANPWTNYPNGELYFDAAAPGLVAATKKSAQWDQTDTATLFFGDRWDSGPSLHNMYGWPEMIGFDEYLKAHNMPGVKGHTRAEVVRDISANHLGQFRTWQVERYARAVQTLSAAYAQEGKKLVISGQGIPIVPQAYEKSISQTVVGMSDDSTWGMQYEDPCFNTAKQMGYMAINPGWKLNTLLNWGYNSAVLGNLFFWAPIGTTEPSRRHYYDRAWRGSVDADGRYHSIHAFGYGSNGGAAFTMSPNDWQQWWNIEERHSLLSPEGPFGAGVVISTAQMADPEKTDFSGGGMGDSDADGLVANPAEAIRHLHENGIDISFSTNAAALDKLSGSPPLIILNLSEFGASEIQALQRLADRGVRMVAFQGKDELSPDAARLFGANAGASQRTLLIRGTIDDFSDSSARKIAPAIQDVLQLPVQFPNGSAGYGFTMGNQHYIVVEDWREEGRVLSVRYRPGTAVKTIHAVNINDNRTLAVRKDGDGWLIDLPTRPGDGNLICVEEEQ